MFGLTGLAARIVGAVLYGLGAFIILFVIGLLVVHFDAAVGAFIQKFAAVIGLLVGLYFFFTGAKPTV